MPEPVYPTRHIYLDDDRDGVVETEITTRVVSDITGSHGQFSQRESDRLAAPGSLKFELENAAGNYEAAASLLGKCVSVTLEYAGEERQIFFGYIARVDMDSGFIRPLRVGVTVVDWMYTANNTQVGDLTVATYQRADEALLAILYSMSKPPSVRGATPDLPVAAVDLDGGSEIFPTVFDSGTTRTKVFSELDKVVKSELGYLYLRFRGMDSGEELRMENRYARGGTRALSRLPDTPGTLWQNSASDGPLLYHGPSGTSGSISVHTARDADLGTRHADAGWNVGAYVLNGYTVTNIPRTVDASPVVLYELGTPIQFGAMQRKYISAGYTNPEGGSIVQAFNVITPVATTDFLFNELQDGSGADLTTNLNYVATHTRNQSVGAFANRFSYGLVNYGPPGYLIFFRVRGQGIYKYNPVEVVSENEESQLDFVRTELTENLTREYSDDTNTSQLFADSAVALRRHPARDLLTVTYNGSVDEDLLRAFMFLEQGDKVRITEIFPAHTGDYYIQGIKFTVRLDGLVNFTWTLREEVKTRATPIIAVAPGGGSGVSAIDFGILPHLSNLPAFSYSCWIRISAVSAGYFLMDRSADGGSGRRGNFLATWKNRKIRFCSYKTPTDGVWETTNVVLTNTGQWYHVAVTYDNTSDAANPVIYIDGTSVAVTETATPSGISDDDSDCPLVLFNAGQDPSIPEQPYWTSVDSFALKDIRIYDRILTAAEVTALAAAEDDYDLLPEGLLFHGIYAPTDNLADYVGATITGDDWVLEAARGAAGVPYNHETDYLLTGEAL